jgi:hypothetical protein
MTSELRAHIDDENCSLILMMIPMLLIADIKSHVSLFVATDNIPMKAEERTYRPSVTSFTTNLWVALSSIFLVTSRQLAYYAAMTPGMYGATI